MDSDRDGRLSFDEFESTLMLLPHGANPEAVFDAFAHRAFVDDPDGFMTMPRDIDTGRRTSLSAHIREGMEEGDKGEGREGKDSLGDGGGNGDDADDPGSDAPRSVTLHPLATSMRAQSIPAWTWGSSVQSTESGACVARAPFTSNARRTWKLRNSSTLKNTRKRGRDTACSQNWTEPEFPNLLCRLSSTGDRERSP